MFNKIKYILLFAFLAFLTINSNGQEYPVYNHDFLRKARIFGISLSINLRYRQNETVLSLSDTLFSIRKSYNGWMRKYKHIDYGHFKVDKSKIKFYDDKCNLKKVMKIKKKYILRNIVPFLIRVEYCPYW